MKFSALISTARIGFLAVALGIGLLFCGWAVVQAVAQNGEPTRKELEAILCTHDAGLQEKDFQKLASTTASAALAKARNWEFSFKRPFPPSPQDEWWESASSMAVPFESLVFMALKKREDRAFLAYHWTHLFKSAPGKEPEKGLSVATFIRQTDGWRLLENDSFESDEITAMTADKDRLAWLEKKGVFSNKETVEMPPEIKAPADYIAEYHCRGYGGIFTLTVNGITWVEKESGPGIVLGGLKKGKNILRIHFEPGKGTFEESGPAPKMRVIAYTGATQPGMLKPAAAHSIFSHQWKLGEPDFETTVELNDEILAGLPKPEETF